MDAATLWAIIRRDNDPLVKAARERQALADARACEAHEDEFEDGEG